MRSRHLTLIALSVFMSTQIPHARAQADHGIAIGPAVGTTGVGLEAWVPLISNTLNLSAGPTGMAFNFNMNVGDYAGSSNYHLNVRLLGVPVVLDYYPFHNWFNLQGGVFINGNKITLNSNNINGNTQDQVTGTSHFNVIAPFVGIGFGQPFAGSRVTFTGNLGVEYAGGPDINLVPGAGMTPSEVAQVQQDQSEIDSRTHWAEVFPVFSLGLAYRF